MKKILTALVIAGCVSLLTAQTAKTGDKSMEGILVSIDKAKNTVIVQVNYAFTVDAAAEIQAQGKKAGLSDLELNSKVNISYFKTPEKERVITKITQKGAAPAKAPEKKEVKKEIKKKVKEAAPAEKKAAKPEKKDTVKAAPAKKGK